MPIARKRPKRIRRGNSRYFMLFLILAIALVGTFFGIVQILKHISWFTVTKIEISGNRFLDQQFLVEVARDNIGKNLFSCSKSELEKKYKSIKRIQKVRIVKVLPNKLKIIITERRSIVYVKTLEGNLFPIDGEKIVLDNRPNASLEDMPVTNTVYRNSQMIVGKRLSSTYLERVVRLQKQIVSLNPDFEKSISEYFMKSGHLVFIETSTGAKVILGESDLPVKIRRFLFLKGNGSFDKNSLYDFRFEDQVVVSKETQ